jgi:iron complex outermembrane recepter protein
LVLRLWLGVCLLHSVQILTGQHCHLAMHGTVYDRETGQGLPFASVVIAGTGKGSVADEHGHYTISDLCEDSVYQVDVSHIDCAHQLNLVKITENTVTDFHLDHSHHELSEVIIQTKAVQLQGAEANQRIDQLSLENVQSRSLADGVSQLAGVYQISAGQNSAKPMIQGLSGNRIAIVQQGVVIEGQQWGSDHAPEVDPFSADAIEVVKGAAGVRYGPGAMGGAILLKEAPWTEGAKQWAETGIGLNGRATWAAVSTEYLPKAKKAIVWKYRLQASIKAAGNLQTPDYFLGNTSSREQNLRMSIHRTAKRSTTTLYGGVFHQKFGILRSAHTGNLTDLMAAIQSPTPLNNQNSFSYEIGNPFQQVSHFLVRMRNELKLSEQWVWELSLNWQYNIREEFDAHRNGSINGSAAPALSLYNYTTVAESIWKHKPIRHWTGEFGAQGSWQYNQTGTGGYVPDQLSWAGAVYAVQHWRRYPTPVEWELGLRADLRRTHVTDTFGTLRQLDTVLLFGNISANAGLIYTPNEYLRVRANSALAWRPPSAIELYARGVHHGAASYELGTPNLAPEMGWNQSAEIRLSKHRLLVQATAYANFISDFIYLQPTDRTILTVRGAYPLNEYRQSNAQLLGADATIALRLYEAWGLSADLSALRGKRMSSELGSDKAWLPLMPPDRLRVAAVFDGRGTYWARSKTSAWSGKCGWSFIAKQSRVPNEGLLLAPPAAYALWFAEINYVRKLQEGREITFGLSSDNLLDERYRSYLNSFRYFANEPGRQLNLRVRLNF